uniref:Uncharacterized protein n=2 Tax=Oryza sativa subsp. japonica TaxID=39947 RepID=Q10HP7_ORYSJ|nr:hypothetical protein [Oryza sativa Japonica Group]ABF97295.1 hypothetical protein LOC_Os03g38410 [Oryza sativa Japonica Group]
MGSRDEFSNNKLLDDFTVGKIKSDRSMSSDEIEIIAVVEDERYWQHWHRRVGLIQTKVYTALYSLDSYEGRLPLCAISISTETNASMYVGWISYAPDPNICIVYVYGLYWSYMHTDTRYMPRWKSQSDSIHSRVLRDESKLYPSTQEHISALIKEQLSTRVGCGRVHPTIESILDKCGVVAPNLPTKTDDLPHSTGHGWTTREKVVNG